MKKFLSIFMAACIAVSASLSVCAAEAGEESAEYGSLPVWSDGEEISEEFYADILKDIEEREKAEV